MRKKRLINKGMGSIEAIKSGLQRFYMEHGHFPTSTEIDKCPYLCSPRYIQKRYGGLRKLRSALGLNIVDYGKGENRVEISRRVNKLSVETENMVKKFLVERYGEICVHEEKKYGSSKQRVDFFVYAKENFAVDVVNTYELHHLRINLNVKLYKYKHFPFKLFFVVTGAEFSQQTIDATLSHKSNWLSNMQCPTFDVFKKECLFNLPPLDFKIDYIVARE